MVKLLKTMVVFNLLLGGGALYLGIKIFQDREIIKERTQNLEKNANAVADALEWDAKEKEKLAKNLKDPKGMKEPLNDLAMKARDTLSELKNTQADLADTRVKLSETADKLAATEASLNSANREIDTLNTNLARTNDQLTEARERVNSLSTEVSNLNRQVADLKETIVTKDTNIDQLTNELSTATKESDRLREELDICRGVNQDGSGSLAGKSANVIDVSPDWNFIIVDKGVQDQFVTGAKCLVGRNGEIIAEATISMVEPNNSVADLDPESMPNGFSVQKGDTIFFPPNNL